MIDGLSKIVAVLAVFFYVAQYTNDIFRANVKAQQTEALSYIDRFSSGQVLEGRIRMLEFLSARRELAEFLSSGSMSAGNRNYIIVSELEADQAAFNSLRRIGYFFDELSFCHSSEVCDSAILEEFFCEHVIGYERAYFEAVRAASFDALARELFPGARDLAHICTR